MQQLLINGTTKEEEALAFLREHEPEEGYFLGFSGGKDSVVLHDLAEKSGVKYQAYYSCTTIDPPELTRFIRKHYPNVIWKFPNWKGHKTFYSMIPVNGFPTKFARWCCDKLKKDPTKDVPLKHRLMGLRAEESYKRANRGSIEKRGKWNIYKPIFLWKEWEIWEHIDRYEIPYCELYDEGFGRLGCVVCPFICSKSASDQRKLQLHKDRWPGHYRQFEKAMRRLYDNKAKMRQYKHGYSRTFEEFLDNWYHGN